MKKTTKEERQKEERRKTLKEVGAMAIVSRFFPA